MEADLSPFTHTFGAEECSAFVGATYSWHHPEGVYNGGTFLVLGSSTV